jgi:hypothetical protein
MVTRVRLRSTFVERRDHAHPQCYWCDVVFGDAEAILSGKTLDHYIPRAKGGSDHYANLVPCCQFCNWTRDTTNPSLFEQVSREIIQPNRHDIQTVIDLINERDHAMARRAYGAVLQHFPIVPRDYLLADLPKEFDDTLIRLSPRRSMLEKCAAFADHARPLVHQNKGHGIGLGQDVIVHSQMARCVHIPGGFSVLGLTEFRSLKKRCESEPFNVRFLSDGPGFLRWETFTMREHALGVLHYETDVMKEHRVQKVWAFGSSMESARLVVKTIETHKLLPMSLFHPEQYVALWDWDLVDDHS